MNAAGLAERGGKGTKMIGGCLLRYWASVACGWLFDDHDTDNDDVVELIAGNS